MPPKRKASIYLNATAEAILDKMTLETGQTRSSIVSNALAFYGDWRGAIREIFREELARASLAPVRE